ncbi:Agamous-like MADS-box protein AGL61 [Cardamine amara subsp. amara]|uniref:Agamous-like MADS-box protein AGL61 n=1 Tax=Cardamine amara subsp. amara TaxID=228776 RepID=A0ABD1AZG2_CARAN
MSSKKPKGKQKITIKKIEKDEDRRDRLSKRRNGIYTKLSELSVRCGAEVGFLMFSESGKPYAFGSPSFRAVAERFLHGDASSSSSTLPQTILDQQKMQMEELCKFYNTLVEKAAVEKEKAKKMTALAEALPVENDAWWRVELAEVKDNEEVKKLLEKYEGLFGKLRQELAIRSHRERDVGK